MLTLQVLQRNYNGNIIRQRSDNKFLCATDLLAIHNKNNGTIKYMGDFLSSKDYQEHLIALTNHLNSDREFTLSRTIRSLSKQDIITMNDLTIIKKGGSLKGTWLNELSLLKFAMWLSKDFEIWALRILSDNLVGYRLDAGDNFKEMTKTFKETLNPENPMEYKFEAMMINETCFNLFALDRNVLPEKDLAKLNKAQEVNIKLLKNGVLNRKDRQRKLREFFELY